jgi:hypothetical protein
MVKEYLVFFDANDKCIGMPEPVDDDIDIDAALECVPDETRLHGVYTKERLLELGYFHASDFEDD